MPNEWVSPSPKIYKLKTFSITVIHFFDLRWHFISAYVLVILIRKEGDWNTGSLWRFVSTTCISVVCEGRIYFILAMWTSHENNSVHSTLRSKKYEHINFVLGRTKEKYTYQFQMLQKQIFLFVEKRKKSKERRIWMKWTFFKPRFHPYYCECDTLPKIP